MVLMPRFIPNHPSNVRSQYLGTGDRRCKSVQFKQRLVHLPDDNNTQIHSTYPKPNETHSERQTSTLLEGRYSPTLRAPEHNIILC